MIRMYPENARPFTSAKDISEYIYAGKGIVKLEAPSGKNHHYLFQKPLERDAFPSDVIFVYAIHDQCKKFYLGMIEQGKFRLTQHSRFLPDTESVKGAQFIMKMIGSDELTKTTRMKLYHMGTCARCGRKLESEYALQYGIGKKCRKILDYA